MDQRFLHGSLLVTEIELSLEWVKDLPGPESLPKPRTNLDGAGPTVQLLIFLMDALVIFFPSFSRQM